MYKQRNFEFLSNSFFKVTMEIVDKKIKFCKVNSIINIPLRIRNISTQNILTNGIDGKYPIHLSYHWISSNGKIHTYDGLRTSLPDNLRPDEEITVDAIVQAPDLADNYYLEFDLVQEFVAWFNDKGNKTIKIPFTVYDGDLDPVWPPGKEPFTVRVSLIGGTEYVHYQNEKGSMIEMSGWAASRTRGAPVDNLEVCLDSKMLVNAEIGLEKKNIFKGKNIPQEFINCGWHTKFKIPELNMGYHLLELYARSGCESQVLTHATTVISVKNNEITILDHKKSGFSSPLPPQDLIYLVAGTDSYPWFVRSGGMAFWSIENILAKISKRITDFDDILDFGCGCGRVISHLQNFTKSRIFGADYNPKLIEWCKKNLAPARFEINQLSPPIDYENEKFDLIYAFSVFTHMSSINQRDWLQEFSRLLKKGGFLLISTHGKSYRNVLNAEEGKLFDTFGIVARNLDVEGSNTCMAYQRPESLNSILPENMKIIQFISEGAKGNPHQDLILIEKL